MNIVWPQPGIEFWFKFRFFQVDTLGEIRAWGLIH